MQLRRRLFGGCLAVAICDAMFPGRALSQGQTRLNRVNGMLMGSLIGDALGGPVEFLDRDRLPADSQPAGLANARQWQSNRRLDHDVLEELANSLKMASYDLLRPQPTAYGPWRANAKAGTVTDDSRHKIVLLRALAKMVADGGDRMTKLDLARELIDFRPHLDHQPSPALASLVEEGLREYRYASRWLLGERENAYPVERLWAGVSNCSGQMALLPLAGVFAGDPERAYRESFEIDFIDAPIARDICAALNAALAATLNPELDSNTPEQRWRVMMEGFRTDPYHFGHVPYAGRQLDRWLDLADSIVLRANGCPAELYRLLEQEGEPRYYWDAHFTLLVPLTMLKACDFEPLAAMHLTLDFGHDSDSYAQVLGAMIGAVHGQGVFPEKMVVAVADRLLADFGESVERWEATIDTARKQWKHQAGR